MKKLLLFSLLLWQFNCELKAQANIYHPFPNDSALWYEESTTNSPLCIRSLIKMLGDTVINVTNYNKLYIAHNVKNAFDPPASVPKNFSYAGALREHAKKIYYIPASGNEKLVYDFNATIGDTVFFHPNNVSYYLVTSIDSILLANGKYRKSFNVQDANGGVNSNILGKVIEGIGTTAGLFEITALTVNSSNFLRCFSINNQQRIFPAGTSLYNCPFSITVGITDLVNNKITFKVMPNPTTDFVKLQLNCNSKINFTIVNPLGQTIHKDKIDVINDFSFDFSSYENGIYLITITDEFGNSAVKKIIKQ